MNTYSGSSHVGPRPGPSRPVDLPSQGRSDAEVMREWIPRIIDMIIRMHGQAVFEE